MHKCHPGDLAIVVYAYNTVNIGTIVKVLAVHPDQLEIQCHPEDVLWTCQAAHPMTYSNDSKKKKFTTGPVPDTYLKPIRGEPMGKDIALGVLIDYLRQEQHAQTAVIERVESYF